MSVFERRVLAELRKLREAEAALEGMYETLQRSPTTGDSFMASLRTLDERVNQFEMFLERAA